MTTALLVGAVAAGLACPLHVWWRMRRGKRAACCPPAEHDEDEAVAVQRRQQALRAQLAALDGGQDADERSHDGYAVRP